MTDGIIYGEENIQSNAEARFLNNESGLYSVSQHDMMDYYRMFMERISVFCDRMGRSLISSSQCSAMNPLLFC